jgi:hypothetical protein
MEFLTGTGPGALPGAEILWGLIERSPFVPDPRNEEVPVVLIVQGAAPADVEPSYGSARTRCTSPCQPRPPGPPAWTPRPLASSQRIAGSTFLAHSGPAQFLALRPGPPEPRLHPFHDHGPLELGEHAEHLQHGLVGRRRGVEPLLVEVEIDAPGSQLAQQGHAAQHRLQLSALGDYWWPKGDTTAHDD